MPSKITASYRIVTPMFIGDANQQASGISPTSVKGALRFWWRALNWGRFLTAAENEADALRKLHKHEAELFGGLPENEQTGKSEMTGGQGAFLLRVEPDNIKLLSTERLDNEYPLNGAWQSYLLGLGLIRTNHYLRSAIVSGNFSVQLYCKNSQYLEELETLLLLWGLLGGLGSRQRKGLGSISITELKVSDKIIELPQNQQAVLDTLKKLIDKSATGEPPFTAFSQSSKILCSLSSHQTAWQTLAEVAEKMQRFRGWGFKRNGNDRNGQPHVHKINEQIVNHAAHSHKQTDHDIVYDYANRTVRTKQLPKSITFGLPRAYKLSNGGGEFKLDVHAANQHDEAKRSRRASPVFIHVHQFPNNDSMIIQSFLPATFLAANDQVQIQQKIGNRWDEIGNVTLTTDWQVINDYLSTFNPPNWQTV
jgi:CRISPR-associated protein Cmr1